MKKILNGIRYLVFLFGGLIFYRLSRSTPPSSYQSMIGLFCITRGRSNSILSKFVSSIHPPYFLNNPSGILGNMIQEKLDPIVRKLDQDGYYVFENRLSEKMCDEILAFSLAHPLTVRRSEGSNVNEKPVQKILDRESPEGVRYDFDSEDLLDFPTVQEIFSDLSFLAVAQAYLKSQPILDVTSLWWHTAHSKVPSKEAAQYYHFDMDRIKWLKFFFYLTDVTTENGPHCFVAGSHRDKGIPAELLKHGYARLSDEEVARFYKKEDFIEFTGPNGTIIAEDTRGLHKGKMVKKGDRCVFQIQYSNSLFGGKYPKSRMKIISSENLKSNISRFRRVYSNYL